MHLVMSIMAGQLQGCKLVPCMNQLFKVLVATTDAQWKGMWDLGSARNEPALLPPCPTIRVLHDSVLC